MQNNEYFIHLNLMAVTTHLWWL